MKFLVVNNMVPFLKGGAERLASNLVTHLRLQGHEADLLRIPFRWDPPERIYDEILACRMMRLYNVDRVIGLKFPAYLIPHPHKTLWLVHQFRQAYDLAGTAMSHLPKDEAGEHIRHCVSSADRECFNAAQSIFTISGVVRKRLDHFNGIPAQVLCPPLDDAADFKPEATERYVFCGGRVNDAKRQHLLVEAMAHVRSDVRLVIAGPPDTPEDGRRLQQLVADRQLSDRVQLDLGYLPRARIVRYVNRSLACACIPYDEDYGYVTLEAFYAGKPVLATHDAGGVLDFVEDRRSGRVVAPQPTELAAAIDEMADNPRETMRWGEAARAQIHQRNINWPETIRRLVA
jgi:glycosyltransferase involved in cell wall biosynthesis